MVFLGLEVHCVLAVVSHGQRAYIPSPACVSYPKQSLERPWQQHNAAQAACERCVLTSFAHIVTGHMLTRVTGFEWLQAVSLSPREVCELTVHSWGTPLLRAYKCTVT
eukprot:scpid58064/ scgid8467/ 